MIVKGDYRIAVIGTSGSGKSTLAQRLAKRLGVPHVELDAINWQAGWRDIARQDPPLFLQRVAEAIAAPAWVTDGNYSIAMPRILDRASDVVWLDLSRATTMRRVIGRSFVRAIGGRELWPGTGNREAFGRWLDKEHPIRWAWDTYRQRRARYAMLFADLEGREIRTHRLSTPQAAEAFIESFP